MSPLEIAFGIAVIGGLAYYVIQRNKKVEVDAPVAAYKVETPVVEEVKPEVAPAPVAVETPEPAPAPKKARAKPAKITAAEKPAKKASKTEKPAKQPTTKAKTAKAVSKKAKIRVVK